MTKAVACLVGGVLFIAAFAPYTDESKWSAYVVFTACVAASFVLALRHILWSETE